MSLCVTFKGRSDIFWSSLSSGHKKNQVWLPQSHKKHIIKELDTIATTDTRRCAHTRMHTCVANGFRRNGSCGIWSLYHIVECAQESQGFNQHLYGLVSSPSEEKFREGSRGKAMYGNCRYTETLRTCTLIAGVPDISKSIVAN